MPHIPIEPHHIYPRFGPGLLKLPASVRLLIYDLVGICGATVSDLSKNPGKGCFFDLSGIRHQPAQIRPQFHGLLLSCRIIYKEASRLLYATNRFSIQFSAQGSLAALRHLRPASLGVLSHLQIILAEASCHYPGAGDWIFGHDCCSDLKNVHCLNDVYSRCKRDHRHDAPLEGPDAALSSEWDVTVTCLAGSIAANTLSLAVVCDVCPTDAGVELATSTVSSLLRLPVLKHCSIRLCQKPEPRLNKLAHDAVLQTRHILPPHDRKKSTTTSSSSRLLSLPAELRARILSYTDLITPWTEVTWSPQQGGFLASHIFCDNLAFAGAPCPPRLHHGCQFARCYITYPEPSDGCFCRLQHSAFSSTAAACKCWAPPQALFFVCKLLRTDAQAVFYAGNRFVVHDDCDSTACNASALASRFLRLVVTADALRHLRFLELVFPRNAWPQAADHALVLQVWAETLDWAREKVNAAALTLRVVVAVDVEVNSAPVMMREGWGNGGGFIDTREEMAPVTRAEAVEMIAGFMRVVGPLARLGDLHAFYAHPGALWRDAIGGQRQAAAVERKLKETAERLVLGQRYEAQYAGGLEEPERSVWPMLLWSLRHNSRE